MIGPCGPARCGSTRRCSSPRTRGSRVCESPPARSTFAANAQVAREGASIVLTTLGAPAFTLRVQPEVAEAPDGAFDAANIALTLPGSLTVGPGISPQITGGLDVQGFGSDLSFTPDASSPTIAGGFCRFPLTAADAQWTLAGNRSTLAQFAGSATIDFPCWALPMSTLELGEITSAPHGGSLIARVQGALMSTVAGMSGPPFGWMVSTLTVNARCVELDGLQVLPGGRTEIAFWTGARSSFVFHQQPLRQLRFRSERGGIDALAVRGGEQRNLWDLPRGASATPFAFTGTIDTFGLIAGSVGMVVSCAAEATPPADAHGLALENLYLVVRAPRRCALAAALEAGAVQGPHQPRLSLVRRALRHTDAARSVRRERRRARSERHLPGAPANGAQLDVGAGAGGPRASRWSAGSPPSLP